MSRPYKHRSCKSLTKKLDNQNAGSSIRPTTSNRTILDLPPEMLEKVLEKLEPIDLLTCRLVKCDWKASSNKLLERNALSLFTKWNILKGYNPFDLRIPSMCVNLSSSSYRNKGQMFRELIFGIDTTKIQYSKMECPSEIGKDNCPGKNPFPSNALHLMIEHRSKSRDRPEVEIYPFFANYGKFLTNLILFRYRTGTQEFSAFLSSLPNLKSLTLECVCIKSGPTSNELPPLPHLTHLRISSSGANGVKIRMVLDEDAVLWILGKYSDQLVGLSILGQTFLTLDEQGNIEYLRGRSFPVGKLQQLKLNSSNKAFLKLTETANLTHIHIMSDVDAFVEDAVYNLENEATIATLFPLIQRFSQSLIYLRLSNVIGNVEQPVARHRQPVRFPSLKTVGVRAPIDPAETMRMRTIILPAFQAVEKLEFIHYPHENIIDIDAVTREEYWRLCPNLHVLSVFDDENYRAGVEVPERRKIIWSLAEHGR